MPKNEFDLWLNIFTQIRDSIPSVPNLSCPSCGESTIDFQYVGRKEDRMGYMQIWCLSCKKGIHLSRVKIPEEANMMSIKCSSDELRERIPYFEEIEPDY